MKLYLTKQECKDIKDSLNKIINYFKQNKKTINLKAELSFKDFLALKKSGDLKTIDYHNSFNLRYDYHRSDNSHR